MSVENTHITAFPGYKGIGLTPDGERTTIVGTVQDMEHWKKQKAIPVDIEYLRIDSSGPCDFAVIPVLNDLCLSADNVISELVVSPIFVRKIVTNKGFALQTTVPEGFGCTSNVNISIAVDASIFKKAMLSLVNTVYSIRNAALTE